MALTYVDFFGWTDCGHDAWRPGCVLDPYVGSGTTLAVAFGLGRSAIGIDLDRRNVELARARRHVPRGRRVMHPPVVDILGVVGTTPWFPVQLRSGRIHVASVVNHVERRCRCDGGPRRPFSYDLLCGGFRGPEEVRLETGGLPTVVNCMRCRARLREIAAELDRSLDRLSGIRADVLLWLSGALREEAAR